MSRQELACRLLPRVFALISAVVLSGGSVMADGKMYAEKVNPDIPYQRALILFEKGRQTLVLQSQYQIPGEPGDHTLGWVVPVPSVPEIRTTTAEIGDWWFNHLSDISRPEEVEIKLYLILPLLIIFPVLFVICLAASFVPRFLGYRTRLRRVSFLSLGAGACVILVAPTFIRARKGIRGIEIVQSGRIGIYDTKVVKAESAAELIAWFNAHSFRFDQGDERAIQSYIDRKWHFVTATLHTSIDFHDRSAVSSNLLAPLVLEFPVPNPVYPTALTATGGHPTEILIYLVSRIPMKTDSQLTLRFSGQPGRSIPFYPYPESEEQMEWLHYRWMDLPYLSKFKATLTPAQMARDIEFYPEPEAPPFRERIVKW